jgi:hypothetical protein
VFLAIETMPSGMHKHSRYDFAAEILTIPRLKEITSGSGLEPKPDQGRAQDNLKPNPAPTRPKPGLSSPIRPDYANAKNNNLLTKVMTDHFSRFFSTTMAHGI